MQMAQKSCAVITAGNYAALPALHLGHMHSWRQAEGQLPSHLSEPGVNLTLCLARLQMDRRVQ